MRAERSGKSRAVAWTLSVLAVPVLYALSVLPIYYFTHRVRNLEYDQTPKWLDAYSHPYWWTYARLPHTAQEVCRAYDKWWYDLLPLRK